MLNFYGTFSSKQTSVGSAFLKRRKDKLEQVIWKKDIEILQEVHGSSNRHDQKWPSAQHIIVKISTVKVKKNSKCEKKTS